MGKSLVIVESPAKAKTINKFLGKNFVVMASVGHIKDLPKSKLGVDVEKGFEPQYVKIKGKAKTISDLKKAAKSADRIYLAPDPDREGEAIAWHIASEVDKDCHKTSRVLFNEITEKAVKAAIKVPIKLDRNKYEAQQARRILDRLVGYQVSPILWDKVRRGLSAGRVQSVAVRLICERESAIKAFKPKEYWSITAELETPEKRLFSAKLAKRDGKKFEVGSETDSRAVLGELKDVPFVITDVTAREVKRRPSAPFTTSKLQMDASRKLGFSAKKTMMVAQQLYEGIDLGKEGPIGLITYMRTDSTRLSAEAVDEVRGFIEEVYGARYLPEKPVEYKSGKKAQDAHEAIRPTYVRYPPEKIKQNLTRDQLRLYTLIWNRFVSCQMAPALFDQTRAQITAGRYLFTTAGSVMKFAGFMAVYTEAREKEDEIKEKESNGTDVNLPELAKDAVLGLNKLSPLQHFTQPPPRYTEASLVKELEENGIGRPSTYAAILSTVQDRGYVEKEQRQLKPTDLGVLVTDMLVENFPEILNVEFTAKMEEELDKVEEGSLEWRKVMGDFYGPFKESVTRAAKEMKNIKGEETPTDIVCEKCSKPMVIKWGRLGKFLACSGYPECKSTMDFTTDESGKVTPVDTKVETDEKCPKCSAPMVIKSGRFGRFLACTRYPECKSTKAISTNVPCGEEGCDGKLVERRTKRGRVFYGCSNYPKCEYATWKLPNKGDDEQETEQGKG